VPPPVVIEAVDPARITLEEVSDHTLVTIELGYGLVHLVDEKRGAPLVARITGVRKQLSQSFGFVVPQFRVRDSLDLMPDSYRIVLGGVALGGASIKAEKVLAIDAGEANPDHSLRGEATMDPSFGCPALWIEAGQRDHAIAEGFLTVDASTVVATHLNQVLGERPQALLGPDEVRAILDGVRDRAPGLVETVHPQPITLGAMTRLLHALLEDGVSIAHPLPILSALAEAVLQTNDHDKLVDLVRASLGGMLVSRICGPSERLAVLTLDGALEQMIVGGMHDPVTGQPVIEPDLARSIGERIAAIIAERGPVAAPVALIVQPRARRALAALLRARAPQCAVLSISELPPSQPIEVIEVVGAADPDPTAIPPQDLAA
jgi:flagellar biosynthesis protein FlhA